MLDQNAFGATLFRFVPQEHGLFFFSGSNLCAGQISLLVSSWLIHLQDPWISHQGELVVTLACHKAFVMGSLHHCFYICNITLPPTSASQIKGYLRFGYLVNTVASSF